MSGVSGIINGISNTNNLGSELLLPAMEAAAAAALCLKLEPTASKDTALCLICLENNSFV